MPGVKFIIMVAAISLAAQIGLEKYRAKGR